MTPEADALIRSLRSHRRILRSALIALVGASDVADLEEMETVLRLAPAPAEDKAAAIDGIHALQATMDEPVAAVLDRPAPPPEVCPETNQGLTPLPHEFRCTMCGLIAAARPTQPPEAKPCQFGVYCHKHGFTHGAEAEELRSRLEHILARDGGSVKVPIQPIRQMLDDVDARDSLAWLEARDAAESRPAPPPELSGGRCPVHPLNGIPCYTCAAASHPAPEPDSGVD